MYHRVRVNQFYIWSLQKQNAEEHRIAKLRIWKEIIYEAGVKKENGIFSREKRGESAKREKHIPHTHL